MKMEEWKEYKLGDIDLEVIDGDRGKNYPHQNEFLESGFCLFLSAKNVTKSGFSFIENQYISQEKDSLLNNGKLKRGDIVITTRGTVGNVAIFSDKIPYNNIRINSGMLIIRCGKTINNFYLYHVLRSELFYNQILSIQSGSAQPQLPKSHFLNMMINLPPLPTQQKIAAILSSLDDKIELNNKINTNLEQQAQALFKNWFVDFEPFGGKMPEGWKEIPLEELCTVVTKGTTPTTLGKKFTEVGINFIKGESILDNHTFDLQKISHIDDETNLMLKRSIIQPNDILFTIAGTLGRFAIIDETLTPANTNQAVGIIRANPKIISPYYLYSFFIGNWHNDYYTKRIQQAVQANLSLGTIKSLPIIIPDSQNLNKYTALIEPLFKQMKQLENENIKLADLRDTLLPKLMNGKIEV